MRIAPLLLSSLSLLVLTGANRIVEGIPFSDPATSGESGMRARVVFTSNQLGEFEPCACKDLPLGGLAQATGLVQELREASEAPLFFFDAGDRFFRFDVAAISQEEAQRRLKAMLMVDAGNVGRLDAAGIGGLELGAGLEYLKRLDQRARYPMVSANLTDHDGALLFPASVVIERGGLRVGLTSVLPGKVWHDDYETSDPMKAARDEVKTLRAAGVDLVVLASNLGLDGDKKLARVAKPDLLLGSRSREILSEGQRVGGTVISHAGSRGRYLGEVRWYGEGKGRGPHLVATTVPVMAAGRRDPAVEELVNRTLLRLADPRLGVEPIYPWDPRHPAYSRELEGVQ